MPKAFVFVELPTPITTSILVWKVLDFWMIGRTKSEKLVALVGFVGRKIQQKVDVVTSLCYFDLLSCFKDLNLAGCCSI